MTLLVLSDSHGRPDHVEEAIRRVHPDGILFAGDGLRDLARIGEFPCPLWAVSGNCDWSRALIVNGRSVETDEEELITVEGIRILLIHGHKYGVKGGLLPATYRAMEREADILVFGHTHTPVEFHLLPHDERSLVPVQKALTLFNPGSIGDSEASFGTITIRDRQVLCGHGNL